MGEKGIEPLTPWFVATRSNPLSYTPSTCKLIVYLNYKKVNLC